jgi:hypothetical protein
MDLLKTLKNHYEKVLLGAVLVGLAVAAALLPIKISSEKQKLNDLTLSVTHPVVKPLTNLDLSPIEGALKRAAAPATMVFAPPHKLFNPLPWQKAADARLVPLDDTHIGPKAVAITKMTPLYLKLSLDSVQVVDSGPKYVIGFEREAAIAPRDRPKKQAYCSVGTKNEAFTLRDVQGLPESPTNLVVELRDGEIVNLSTNAPFRRIDGYMADLRYDPEKKSWRNQRIGSSIAFNGEDYSVVAVNQNEVVLSAKSNQKKWTVKHNSNATPEPR